MKTAQVSLVTRGAAQFCLQAAPPQEAEAILECIGELATHLEACLGRPVVWVNRDTAPAFPVCVTLALHPERDLGREAFEITADPGRVTLAASSVMGLRHAVYYFLEHAFGVRWLWPGPAGTVTPPAVEVAWPIGTRRLAPDWAWRRLWVGGAFWGEQDPALAEISRAGVSPATLGALQRWQLRNRLGGLNIADGHRWCQICPPEQYGKEHPEYFALVNGRRDTQPGDGKHGNQPCTSNPEVVRLVAAYILAQFRARPDLDGYSISVNDGAGFCECPACRALDEADRNQAPDSLFDRATRETPEAAGARPAAPGSITARMFHFANQIAEQVERGYPGKLLLMLIYSAYRTPPRAITLHPNVMAQFCAMSWAHHSEAVRAADMQLLQALIPVTQRRGIYDYFVNGANGSLPRGFGRVFSRSLDAYYQAGCRHFATQAGLGFALDGFNYYLAARRLWDMDLAPDEVLRDYCRSGFGAGSEGVCCYLTAFMDRWEAVGLGAESMEAAAGILYPAAWRAERRGELERAAAACAAENAARRRVGFLAAGLDFLDALVAACEAAVELRRRGAPGAKPLDPAGLLRWVGACPDPAAVDRAIAARRRLLDWAAGHRDGFWMASLWFDYQCQYRSGLLGAWMDAVEAARNSPA